MAWDRALPIACKPDSWYASGQANESCVTPRAPITRDSLVLDSEPHLGTARGDDAALGRCVTLRAWECKAKKTKFRMISKD